MSPAVPVRAVLGEVVPSPTQKLLPLRARTLKKLVDVGASCVKAATVVPVAEAWSCFTLRRVRVPVSAELVTMFTAVPVVCAVLSEMSSRVPVVTAAPETLSTRPAASAALAPTVSTMVSSVAAEVNSLSVAEVPVAPEWDDRNILPVVVIAVADDAMDKPWPVVSALTTMLLPIPVVRPEYVCNTCVPAVEAVELRSRRTPVVEDVSTEVELMRTSEPPLAITEVVCGTITAVPVVSASATTLTPIPVVSPEKVPRTCVPAADAVDDRLTKIPVVVEVSTPVEDTLRSEPPFAITDVVCVMLCPLPVVRPFRACVIPAPVVTAF